MLTQALLTGAYKTYHKEGE